MLAAILRMMLEKLKKDKKPDTVKPKVTVQEKLEELDSRGPRRTSSQGVNLIKSFEGLRLKAYKDAVGVWTIGYGHTKTAKRGQRITEKRAEKLLRDDLRRFEDGVNRYVKVPLKQHEYDALVSFSFNVGTGALRRSTLLKVLNRGDKKRAADELLKWTRAGSRRLAGLVRRRKAERKMFLGN